MAELSTYMEDRIVNFMRNVAITGEAAAYVALFTDAASLVNLEAGTLTGEVSGGSYARELAGLSASDNGTSSNAGDITFTTATGDWGTITYVALMDAATAGNVLMYSALDEAKPVGTGDTFKINAGDLDVAIT